MSGRKWKNYVWLCMWPINSFATLSKFSSDTGRSIPPSTALFWMAWLRTSSLVIMIRYLLHFTTICLWLILHGSVITFLCVFATVPAFSVLKVELSETISWYLTAAIKGNITKDSYVSSSHSNSIEILIHRANTVKKKKEMFFTCGSPDKKKT